MAASHDNSQRIKRRGVRASRVKLERALAESDLGKKTQAALAERIADLEQLDAAPKDLVSKVFRERFVDPQTLERVARALGVDAETLYLNTPQVPVGAPLAPQGGAGLPAQKPPVLVSRRAGFQIAAAFGAAFLLFVLFTALAIRPAGPWCGLREAMARPATAEGKLGVVVARFEGDPDNRAQQYLAAAFAADPTLAPFTSVIAVCARPRWGGPGELQRKRAEIRERGRRKLEAAGAHLLLWGALDGDDIIVRFISTRRDASPFAVEVSGRPLKVSEAGLELRVPIGRPGEALADLKRLALEFIEPNDAALADLRDEAARSYESSADWLRAAIVSQRNLRRTVDPRLEPQRWAAINMNLCYDLRLLGDYETDENHYRQALAACDEVLQVRAREKFPRDWAAAEINRASALIRLHYFEPNPESARKDLRAAERALVLVIEAGRSTGAPDQRATAQRNLGVVYLRLGELSDGAAAADYFEKGVASLKSALGAIDPSYQPLDWAITQQNICLALYQHGARSGADGAGLVREAQRRCADAVARLSPENAPLDWAMAQNNLAAANAVLAQMEGDADGLAGAAGEFALAQKVYTRDRLPEKWAEVELNLGELGCNLAILTRDARRFETALGHIDSAIEVFISTGNARYRRYAEGLAASINACEPGAIESCVCGG